MLWKIMSDGMNFADKLFDSFDFEDFPVIKYTYVACFKVVLWFVFAVCGWIDFMVY